MRRFALLIIACAGAVWAQAPPRGSVNGRVADSAGAPVRKATVALVGNTRTADQPVPPVYRILSGEDGRFAFADVEPGEYRLFADRTGYLSFVYATPQGVVLRVAAGDRKTIAVTMIRQSFLSGRVLDEDGEPFPNARVVAMRITHSNGTRRLTRGTTVIAGGDGSFSVASLPAGRYYLTASAPPSLTQTSLREMGDPTSYVTTYFPSALDAGSATAINLPAETELAHMDVRVRRSQVFHIAGWTVNTAGTAVPNATITLIDPDVNESPGGSQRIFVIGGAFRINRLLPGRYGLQVGNEGGSLLGREMVTVVDGDVDDLKIVLAPGADIPVHVKIVDADAEEKAKIEEAVRSMRYTLTASDGVNYNYMARVEDNVNVFRGVAPGSYRMGLGGPPGTYVAEIRFGDRDITTRELETGPGGGVIEMTLSPHAAEVSGTVRDAGGNALAGVTVSLWVPGLPAPGTVDRTRFARSDEMGRFRFAGLAPGRYRLAAWEEIDPGLANAPEFHARFDGRASQVELAPEAKETVEPVLIPRKDVAAEEALLP